jgi:hypothetical protein
MCVVGKRCCCCGEVQPLDCFSTDKRKRDGRQSVCKRCQRAKDAERRLAHPGPRVPSPKLMTTPCPKCGTLDRYADGHCRPCILQRQAGARFANPERYNEKTRARYYADVDATRARNRDKQRARRAANPDHQERARREVSPEQQKERIRRWREANRDVINERLRKWRAANRARVSEQERARREANRPLYRERDRVWSAKWRAANLDLARAMDVAWSRTAPGRANRARQLASVRAKRLRMKLTRILMLQDAISAAAEMHDDVPQPV